MIVFFAAGPDIAALARQACANAADSAKGAGGKVDPYDMGLGDYDPSSHWYGMGIEIDKCIGCNRCVEACKAENNVPEEPYYFRTWVERYSIKKDGEVIVKTIETKPEGVEAAGTGRSCGFSSRSCNR
jgi:ferredoxin